MGLLFKAKETIKKIIKKILGVHISRNSFFSARAIIDDQVFCQWKLSKENERNFLANKDNYLCIRIYDITNSNSNKDATCVMKEVILRKNSKQCLLTTPVSDGRLFLEIGYREAYGRWFLLSSSLVTLGSRPLSSSYRDDSWFYFDKESNQIEAESIHDRVYQISMSGFNGGSEAINKRN